jgi:hypothetical protein
MQTLDVYQVQGIVKQAQAEFRLKFEQDHPDIVEFLAEEILKRAREGETTLNLSFEPYLQKNSEELGKDSNEHKVILFWFSQEKNIQDIVKYLNFKGLYTKRNQTEARNNGALIYQYDTKTIDISWPKG